MDLVPQAQIDKYRQRWERSNSHFFNITWPAVSPKKSKITSSRGNFFSRFHDSCPPCGRLKNSQNMQHSENGESQNSNDSQAVSFSMWCFSHIWCFFLSNRPHSLWVYRRAGGEWFASFFQHPVWLYYCGKPVENAFYCFYKTIVTSRNFASISRRNNP